MSLIRAKVIGGKVSGRNINGEKVTVRPTDPDPHVYVTPSYLKAAVNLLVEAPLPHAALEPAKKVSAPAPEPELRTAVPPADAPKDEPPLTETNGDGAGEDSPSDPPVDPPVNDTPPVGAGGKRRK